MSYETLIERAKDVPQYYMDEAFDFIDYLARKAERERPDPFYCAENQRVLAKSITDMESGVNCHEHELIEA